MLIHGDCLEEMKNIPDNSVDMCLTDPPYGTTACKWDSIIPFGPMWAQLKRIVKGNGAICLFGTEPFSSTLRHSNIGNYKYDWIWKKNKPDGFLQAKRRPMRSLEFISVFNTKIYNAQLIKVKPYKYKRKASGVKSRTMNKIADNNSPMYEMRDFKYPNSLIEFKKPSQSERLHPTQKPIALLEYLIKTYTLENETVLDFTMGSGSTGVACKSLCRKFIGIEKDRKYFEIARDRITMTLC